MESVLLPLAVGVAVGFVVGALGGGGGILTVPILVYLLGQDPHTAATSSLVIVGVTSAVAVLAHARSGRVRWAEGAVFGLLGSIAAWGGAVLSLSVRESVLMALFATLLLVVAVLMLQRAWLDRKGRRAEADRTARGARGGGERTRPIRFAPLRVDWRGVAVIVLWASVVGLLTGFFGVGGGFAAVPALVLALGYRTRVAVGTSLLVIVLNSAVGLVARLGEGASVDWVLVAVFTAASSLTGLLGARLSARTRPDVLSAAFGLLLAVVSVVTAIQALPGLLG